MHWERVLNMKNHKLTIIIICVLVALTAALAMLHLTTRQQETEGAIQVVYQGKTIEVPLSDLSPVQVTGTMITGKGEHREIDAKGVDIYSVLKLAGVDLTAINEVLATSADEYTVSLSAEEVQAGNIAWLLLEEDGSLRLFMAADQNSKRNVKNVVRLTVE